MKKSPNRMGGVESADEASEEDKPADDESEEGKPVDEASKEEKPADDESEEGKPTDDASQEEKPADDESEEDKPADDPSKEEKPADDASKEEESADKTEEPAESETPEEDVPGDSSVSENGLEVTRKKTTMKMSARPMAIVDGKAAFGNFDADAWCTASAGWKIYEGNGSNMWAPDVIFNSAMNKYCMYLSLNGAYQNSVVILLTADAIEGPYSYQGPVVYSGFVADENAPTSYKNTDMKFIFGEGAELPERYQKISGVTLNDSGKITGVSTNEWGEYWPHAIDPAVFYDDNGKLWMIYGSWSGGIYALELDETTGLRDYTVNYTSDFEDKQKSVTSDPYFGKKIAGGHYVSGEGPYIEKIGNYYYLFMSYGFYAPNGGYNMRIFRSTSPDGPYVDTTGKDAIFTEGKPNFIANYTDDKSALTVDQIDTRGMRLMTFYQWDHMTTGEVAQGHNSAIVDGDRAYVIYHTKFNNNTAEHQLRVHELFQNKNGWIVASPFAFANDEKVNYAAEPTDVAGEYEILVGDYSLGYNKDCGTDLSNNYKADAPLAEIITYTLTNDQKIKKGDQEVGTWAVESGQAYATLTIDGHSYSGVFAKVTKDSAGFKTMSFTGVDETTGITLWGAKKLGGKAIIANHIANPSYTVPGKVYGSFTLPSKGGEGVDLYWESGDESLVKSDGTIDALPDADTNVTFTMTMVCGDYYYQKEHTITVAKKDSAMEDGRYLVGEAYTNVPLILPPENSTSMTNPYYITNTAGLDLSGGVSMEFDVKHNGAVQVLGALFAFNDKASGKLYFTQGSYLGYNASGGFYDANLNNYTLVKDYIGEAISASDKDTAHVTINLSAAGFEVLVDDTKAYDQTILDTENGTGDLTDYTKVLTWLQESASTLHMGTGSWWNDVKAQAVISNMKFYINPSDENAVVDGVIAALRKQIPESASTDIVLPVTGEFGARIAWVSSDPSIIAADGKVTVPELETEVTLTATVTKGNVTKTAEFKVKVAHPETPGVVLERELLELKTNDQIERISNPFYEKKLKSLVVDYDIIFSEGAPKNGWDGIFAFYNSATTGRVSFQTNPYICLNEFLPVGQENLYLDINRPNQNTLAENLKHGQEYNFKIVISETECRIYQDGQLIASAGNTKDGNADFAELLRYVAKCDMFSWGVGLAASGGTTYWNTELCTLKNIRISSGESREDVQDKVDLTEGAVTEIENPLFGKKLDEVVLDFKAKFADDAYMAGWDGLLAFYQPSEGAPGGRVSVQSAPYICYNETEAEAINKWMDINNPNDLGKANITVPVTTLDRTKEHHYYIRISEKEITMEIDGTAVPQVKGGPSGITVTYRNLLDYISKCQKFSWGVTPNVNCFWAAEKCTLTDAVVRGYYSKEYGDVEEDNQKVTVTLHYPDGKTESLLQKKNSKVKKPVSEGTDENGEYTVEWYTDEAKTTLYDFDQYIKEDLTLYGVKKYQQGEVKDEVTVTLHYPDEVKIQKVKKGEALTKPEFADQEDANGKYNIRWYADEEKKELYDFTKPVTEDIDLYGMYYYYCEEPTPGEDGNKVKTGIWVEKIKDQEWTGAAVKPLVKVYDGETLLKEKTDYKVSYSNNIKVSTQLLPAKVNIIPNGNYEKNSKFSVAFNIVKRSISNDNVTIKYKPELNVKKNNKKQPVKQIPAITLKWGKKTIPAKDYVVSYQKDGQDVAEVKDAGEYKIIIQMKDTSSYVGTLEYPLVVTEKILTGSLKFKLDKNAHAYTGEAIQPTVTVTYKNKPVSVDDNFIVTYENNTEIGTAAVTLRAKPESSYYGSKTINFKINGTAINKTVMKGFVSSSQYTGAPVTQSGMTLEYKGTQLTLHEDYEVAYTPNVNAGKVTMTITGKKGYSGTVKKVFTISKVDLTKKNPTVVFLNGESAPIEVIQDKSGATPEIKVSLDQKELIPEVDYKVSYSDNKKVGTAKVTVKGIGNYSGTLRNKLTFTIKAKNIADESIAIVPEDLQYKANGSYRAKVAIYDNGVKLSSGEFAVGVVGEVTYDKDAAGNDTKCGKAQIVLTGKKNYAGTKTVDIRIAEKLISAAKVTFTKKYYYANGNPVTPSKDEITVTLGSGKNKVTLNLDEFDIESISNNTNKGKGTLVIRGKGIYGGTKSVKFTILPKWMQRK